MNAGYLFAYFTTQAEPDGEQVRFARSAASDPLKWIPLHDGRPILVSSIGEGGVRDPFLLRAAGLPGESAKYYLIATDLRIHGKDPDTAWTDAVQRGSRSIVVWESADLIEWSAPRLVEVSPPDAGNTWAPEATFDAETGSYFVYWASTLYDDAESDRRGAETYHRMLAASTTDFRTFTKAAVWVDPGRSVIDATVAWSDGWWYRFIKDERAPDSSTPAAKFITVERSRQLRSTRYEFVADRLGARAERDGRMSPGLEHGEGPIVVDAGDDGWYLFIDEFGLRRYVPFHSAAIDAPTWSLVEPSLLPPGASHGSVLTLDSDELARLTD